MAPNLPDPVALSIRRRVGDSLFKSTAGMRLAFVHYHVQEAVSAMDKADLARWGQVRDALATAMANAEAFAAELLSPPPDPLAGPPPIEPGSLN